MVEGVAGHHEREGPFREGQPLHVALAEGGIRDPLAISQLGGPSQHRGGKVGPHHRAGEWRESTGDNSGPQPAFYEHLVLGPDPGHPHQERHGLGVGVGRTSENGTACRENWSRIRLAG